MLREDAVVSKLELTTVSLARETMRGERHVGCRSEAEATSHKRSSAEGALLPVTYCRRVCRRAACILKYHCLQQ
jgi:hypothetical protein